MKKVITIALAAAIAVFLFPGTPAVAAGPVRLGVAGAHSGDLASYGLPTVKAAQLVVDEINAAGGVLGQPVELLIGPFDQDDGFACFEEGESWFLAGMVDIFQDVPFQEVLSCKPGDIGTGGPSGPSGAADNFVQAADDARAVILFLHNWSIPEY